MLDYGFRKLFFLIKMKSNEQNIEKTSPNVILTL